MTISFTNYTRKAPDIEVVVVQDLGETADWLELNLPSGETVNRGLISYGTLLYTNAGATISLSIGSVLCVDSNNKIFKIDREILNAFYDAV